MQKAIQFRSMLDSLNLTEFEMFLNALFNQRGKREIITKSLFYLISDECRRNDHNYCNDINKIITNIIHQRKLRQGKTTIIARSQSVPLLTKDSNSDNVSISSTNSAHIENTETFITIYFIVNYRQQQYSMHHICIQ